MPGRRVALMMGPNRKKAEPYEAALRSVGLDPVVNPESLVSMVGVLLGGGSDINPKLYGEKRLEQTEAPDDERDKRELEFLQQAERTDLPVLAICRGMQLLNVVHEGSLQQHIGESHRKRGVPDAHPISVVQDSQLARILEREELSVNSRHHQAVCRVGDGLKISASCPADDIIEGLENPNCRFVIGVQWHPEDRTATHPEDRFLFQAFARAIAENRK